MSIPQDAVELLKQEHAKHPDNPWMFPSGRTGEMYHPDSVVTLHKRILKDAGLEHIRFHDLRHTFATLALQNGVDVKTVSSMLGHYDAYAPHLHPRHTADAAKGRRENWQLHGADSISPTGKQRTGKEAISSPVLFHPFRAFPRIHRA